jgi:hypothetical protein
MKPYLHQPFGAEYPCGHSALPRSYALCAIADVSAIGDANVANGIKRPWPTLLRSSGPGDR